MTKVCQINLKHHRLKRFIIAAPIVYQSHSDIRPRHVRVTVHDVNKTLQ